MARLTKLHYAWVVAAITFLTLLGAAGMRATPGVLIVPLENEFGWSRSTISLAVGINIFLYGLIGPFAAAVMERFGLRRTMMTALALIAIGVALTPLMTRPWQLVLLWGVVVGIGSGSTGLVLGATVAARWFAVRRGLVMGVLTASTATGQLIFLPVLASLAVNHGWRFASLTVAAVAAALIPLVAFLMRDRPERCRACALWRPTRRGACRIQPRQPGRDGAFRAWRWDAFTRFLAARRQLFYLRRLDKRIDRHAFDPGLRRSRHL